MPSHMEHGDAFPCRGWEGRARASPIFSGPLRSRQARGGARGALPAPTVPMLPAGTVQCRPPRPQQREPEPNAPCLGRPQTHLASQRVGLAWCMHVVLGVLVWHQTVELVHGMKGRNSLHTFLCVPVERPKGRSITRSLAVIIARIRFSSGTCRFSRSVYVLI
jgi:hypothetical protein